MINTCRIFGAIPSGASCAAEGVAWKRSTWKQRSSATWSLVRVVTCLSPRTNKRARNGGPIDGACFSVTCRKSSSMNSWEDNVVWQDPIVAEVHRTREKLSAEFDFDVKAIFRNLRKRQAALGVIGDNYFPPQRQLHHRHNCQSCFFARNALRPCAEGISGEKHAPQRRTYVNWVIVAEGKNNCRYSWVVGLSLKKNEPNQGLNSISAAIPPLRVRRQAKRARQLSPVVRLLSSGPNRGPSLPFASAATIPTHKH